MKMWHVTAHVVSQLTKRTAQAAGEAAAAAGSVGGGGGWGLKARQRTGKRKKGKQKTTLGNEKYTLNPWGKYSLP